MDEQRALTAISPLDGRYAAKCDAWRELFSEQGLIKRRVLVEVRWLQFLAKRPEIGDFPRVSPVVHDWLDRLAADFGSQEASRVKAIEKITNHDVKAVEYFISEQLAEGSELARLRPFVHFACTSEDINNIAYALILRSARDEHLGAGIACRACQAESHGSGNGIDANAVPHAWPARQPDDARQGAGEHRIPAGPSAGSSRGGARPGED